MEKQINRRTLLNGSGQIENAQRAHHGKTDGWTLDHPVWQIVEEAEKGMRDLTDLITSEVTVLEITKEGIYLKMIKGKTVLGPLTSEMVNLMVVEEGGVEEGEVVSIVLFHVFEDN